MPSLIVHKIVTDKRQNKLSEHVGRSILKSQNGQFLSHEEVGVIDWIKTPWTHAKTEISASKNIIHSFHAVLWPMSLTQKMTFQYI